MQELVWECFKVFFLKGRHTFYRNKNKLFANVPHKTNHKYCSFVVQFLLSLVGLCKVRKSMKRSAGRPLIITSQKKQRQRIQSVPLSDVRLDEVGHWPEATSRRMHCRIQMCKGQTCIQCTKCQVFLCLSNAKNCFKVYHITE